MIRLHGAPREQDMALALKHGNLGEHFRKLHGSRPVHDDAQRAFRPVLTEQHDGLPEIRIPQTRARDQEDAFAERRSHHQILHREDAVCNGRRDQRRLSG